MNWLLRDRRLDQITVALVVGLTVVVAGQGEAIQVPSILGGAAAALPLSLIGPLLGVVGLGGMLHAAADPVAMTAARLVRAVDIALIVGVTAAFGSLAVGLVPTGDGIAAARNVAGLAGVALLAAPILGHRSALIVPTAWMLISTLAGAGLDGEPRWWAWPIAAAADRSAATIAGVLFVAGGAVHLMPHRLRLSSLTMTTDNW